MSSEQHTLDHADNAFELQSHFHKTTSRLVALLFVGVVVITSVLTLAGYKAMPQLAENRTPARFPKTTASAVTGPTYFFRISEWLSDRQSFRTPLIALHSALKLHLFGAPLDEKTIIGRDGWYFYGFESMKDDFTRSKKFLSNRNYVKQILIYLEELYYYGRHTNRQTFFMIAPNKHNVYPDKYSVHYKFGGEQGTATLLEAWLERHYPAMTVRLMSALGKARTASDVYYKTDTHWNPAGAKVAVDVLIDSIEKHEPKVSIAPAPTYEVQLEKFSGGNFSTLLGLPLSEDVKIPAPADGWRAEENASARKEYVEKYLVDIQRMFSVMRLPAPETGKLMIIGDSFMTNMAPYAAERFSDTMFFNPWQYPNNPAKRFPQRLISAFDPDVLLVQVVERRLVPCKVTRKNKCPNNVNGQMPSNVRQMRLKAKFRNEKRVLSPVRIHQTSQSGRLVVDLGQRLPEGHIAIARVRLPAGQSGKLEPWNRKLPLEMRHEQHTLNISAQTTEAYVVLHTGSKRRQASLKITGNIDISSIQIDVRQVKDTAKFRENPIAAAMIR